MSPKSDAFLSAAADRSARLWDVRSPACAGMLRTGDSPTLAWDHQGLVFAVMTDDGVVKMFDAKQYDAGPFATFPLCAPPAPAATVRARSARLRTARRAHAARRRRAWPSAWTAACC